MLNIKHLDPPDQHITICSGLTALFFPSIDYVSWNLLDDWNLVAYILNLKILVEIWNQFLLRQLQCRSSGLCLQMSELQLTMLLDLFWFSDRIVLLAPKTSIDPTNDLVWRIQFSALEASWVGWHIQSEKYNPLEHYLSRVPHRRFRPFSHCTCSFNCVLIVIVSENYKSNDNITLQGPGVLETDKQTWF